MITFLGNGRNNHLYDDLIVKYRKAKDILKKVLTYSHANEYAGGKEWYENNFIGWTEGSPAVMPDGKIFKTCKAPLPQELRRYLSVA